MCSIGLITYLNFVYVFFLSSIYQAQHGMLRPFRQLLKTQETNPKNKLLSELINNLIVILVNLKESNIWYFNWTLIAYIISYYYYLLFAILWLQSYSPYSLLVYFFTIEYLLIFCEINIFIIDYYCYHV